MSRCLLITLTILGAGMVQENSARAQAQTVVLYHSASEFPRLAGEGFKVPVEANYSLKIWTPAQRTWALKQDGPILVLTSKVEGTDLKPTWQDLKVGPLKAGESYKIVVEGSTPQEDAANKPASDKNAASVPAPAVPAALVVTNDPAHDPTAALNLVRARTDTVDPTVDPRRDRSRTNQEGAEFRSPATPQAWRDRAEHVREQLLVTLGLWPMFPKTDLRPRIVGKLDRDGYTIEKVILETFPGFTLSGNLYRPIGHAGKVPAILCPHGHWEDGRVNPEVQQRCIRWAKLGAVVFMYDMVGYNDSKAFGHKFLNDRLNRWGLSLPTLQTWNSIRALDWLTTLPDVDPARIGCTGESGGGTQTFLLTAIDPRIKVSAPVVMVSDSFQGGCVCENAAGLRIGTDNVEFAALTAPRPLKLVGATGDWTKLTMTNAYPAIRGVYSLFGTTDRVSADLFDFPHNYNQTTRNAVYAFMGKWLLGIEDSATTKEGVQTTERPEDLWTFTDANPAPATVPTAGELENYLVRIKATQLSQLEPGGLETAWEAARSLLLTSLKIRVGLTSPTPAELESNEARRTTFNGLTVVHSVVGRKRVGEQIPVLRLFPKNPTGRVTVIVSRHGKAGLIDGHGDLNPLVKELLERGQSVVGYDPFLVGESVDAAKPTTSRPQVVHFQTYNPSLAADQMQDLATVLSWAKSQPDVREVSLVGSGLAGPQVLLARPALEGLARTAIDLREFSENDGAGPYPAFLDLPGMLQFGGLKAAAALTSPAPLWIHRTGKGVGTEWETAAQWATKAYAADDALHVLKISGEVAKAYELARWIDTGE